MSYRPTLRVLPVAAAFGVAASAHAQPALIVSRTVYPTGAAVPSIMPNQTVLPNGALAVGDGSFANVFKNETADPSFGVTTGIIIDRRTLGGSILSSYSPGANVPLVTSFSSKSELGLNVSQDGRYVTFMDYAAPVNALDVSNSNTPYFTDPSNPVTNSANPLPTAATAATTPISILPGFPALSASGLPDVSTHPFGLWFGDPTTLFVADEGDGTVTGGANAGLGEYKLQNGVWQKLNTFRIGLTDQASYTQGLPWDVFTDGLRNLTGLANADGSFQLWATTATTSNDTGHDLGADPNELVTITVNADGSASSFRVLETAAAGERIGGVAIADAAVVPEPETYGLVLAGLTATGVLARRRRAC